MGTSKNGGNGDENVTFLTLADATCCAFVDGTNRASSSFDISLSCAGSCVVSEVLVGEERITENNGGPGSTNQVGSW